MSFEMVKIAFGVLQKDFFAYLQAGHFFNTDTKFPQDKTLLGPVEEAIITRNTGFIQYFWDNFQSYNIQNVDKVEEGSSNCL